MKCQEDTAVFVPGEKKSKRKKSAGKNTKNDGGRNKSNVSPGESTGAVIGVELRQTISIQLPGKASHTSLEISGALTSNCPPARYEKPKKRSH